MVKYEIQGKMVVLTGCTKEEENLDFPSIIEDLPVSKVEPNSFVQMKNIKKVVIPGTCKVIGAYAFAGCSNMEELILEEGVETIEDWAFISCSNIKTLSLPQTLKSVGENAFLGTEVKEKVNSFMDAMSSIRRPKDHTNNRCAIFPIEELNHIDEITDSVILERSRFIDNEYDNVKLSYITKKDVDVPFLFDNDTFLLAIFNRKPLEDVTIELSNETNTLIGLYTEDDPDFIDLRVNVLTKGRVITQFICKAPYLEEATFKIQSTKKLEKNGMNYYFYTVKTNFSCFGNGNIEREFAINQYDEIETKYIEKNKNGYIFDEDLEKIKSSLVEKKINTTFSFIKEIDGAPELLFIAKIYEAILQDSEFQEGNTTQFITDRLYYIYNNLNNIESFVKIAFDDIEEMKLEIENSLGVSIDNLAKRYDIQLTDSVGNVITLDEAKGLKNNFVNLETNYNLHGDYLTFIYNDLKTSNKVYAEYEFQHPVEANERILKQQELMQSYQVKNVDNEENKNKLEFENVDNIKENSKTNEIDETLNSVPEKEAINVNESNDTTENNVNVDDLLDDIQDEDIEEEINPNIIPENFEESKIAELEESKDAETNAQEDNVDDLLNTIPEKEVETVATEPEDSQETETNVEEDNVDDLLNAIPEKEVETDATESEESQETETNVEEDNVDDLLNAIPEKEVETEVTEPEDSQDAETTVEEDNVDDLLNAIPEKEVETEATEPEDPQETEINAEEDSVDDLLNAIPEKEVETDATESEDPQETETNAEEDSVDDLLNAIPEKKVEIDATEPEDPQETETNAEEDSVDDLLNAIPEKEVEIDATGSEDSQDTDIADKENNESNDNQINNIGETKKNSDEVNKVENEKSTKKTSPNKKYIVILPKRKK